MATQTQAASLAAPQLLLVLDSGQGLWASRTDGLGAAGYRCEVVQEPALIVKRAAELKPFAVVVSDAPGAGVGLLRLVKRYAPNVKTVLYRASGADPVAGTDAVLSLQRATEEWVEAFRRLSDDKKVANDVGFDARHAEALSVARGLVRALGMRQVETVAHSERLAAWSKYLASALDLGDRVRDAELGGLLHDVGKVGVPDRILLKPGALDAAELSELRKHPALGAEMIRGAPLLRGALDVVMFHHERWDGDGYPERRRAEGIPITARVFAVCDAYEAITQDRPHRAAASDAEARARINESSGTHFDPAVVEVFNGIGADAWRAIADHATRNVRG